MCFGDFFFEENGQLDERRNTCSSKVFLFHIAVSYMIVQKSGSVCRMLVTTLFMFFKRVLSGEWDKPYVR
jgi:hypothetical protein